MTTTIDRPTTGTAGSRASRGRRLASLIRAEVILLVRNRTALFYAVALAPLTVAFVGWAGADALGGSGTRDLAGSLVVMLVALALAIVVYYNLTTTLVARREELVLKRLLTGDVSRGEIIVACATPAVVITLAQLVLGYLAMGVWLDFPRVQNALWLVLAVVGGLVVLALLAVASAGFTRTVETAQLTTLPVLMVVTALSGMIVPLHLMPDVVENVARWTPMYPVVALVQHGLGVPGLDGSPSPGALADVLQPLQALAIWVVLGLGAARRWMRWEPRR